MKVFLLEVSTSEPRQFRLTSVDAPPWFNSVGGMDDKFTVVGVYDTPAECLHVLQSYLRLEETK